MAIDTNDKKWSMIMSLGGTSAGGTLGGGASIEATEDQWVFIDRYWGIIPDIPVGPSFIPTIVSNRSRAFTLLRGP
jgi:hypothetical protein